MSYILDALKRSEQERQQDKMPSFSAESMIMQSSHKKTHWWPYALIIVLTLNVLALLFFNRGSINEPELRTKTEALNSEISTQTKLTSPAAVSISQRRAPPENVVKERQYIQPLEQAQQKHISKNWQQSKNIEKIKDDHLYGTIVDEGLLIEPKTSRSQRTIAPAVDLNIDANSFEVPIQINPSYSPKENVYINPNADEEAKSEVSVNSDNFIEVPLLTDLAVSFQKSVPELTFNSHIYSDKPSQRRVMINDYYLKQGESFDGIQLLEIGEAFIKVSKDDTIFKLPVLRDWAGR